MLQIGLENSSKSDAAANMPFHWAHGGRVAARGAGSKGGCPAQQLSTASTSSTAPLHLSVGFEAC